MIVEEEEYLDEKLPERNWGYDQKGNINRYGDRNFREYAEEAWGDEKKHMRKHPKPMLKIELNYGGIDLPPIDNPEAEQDGTEVVR